MEIRTDWSPSKFEFGKFGASYFGEMGVPRVPFLTLLTESAGFINPSLLYTFNSPLRRRRRRRRKRKMISFTTKLPEKEEGKHH